MQRKSAVPVATGQQEQRKKVDKNRKKLLYLTTIYVNMLLGANRGYTLHIVVDIG